MTQAQRRFVDVARQHGAADTSENGGAQYWDVANDWVKDKGPARALALRNINQTTDALIKAGVITIDDHGLIHLTEAYR